KWWAMTCRLMPEGNPKFQESNSKLQSSSELGFFGIWFLELGVYFATPLRGSARWEPRAAFGRCNRHLPQSFHAISSAPVGGRSHSSIRNEHRERCPKFDRDDPSLVKPCAIPTSAPAPSAVSTRDADGRLG